MDSDAEGIPSEFFDYFKVFYHPMILYLNFFAVALSDAYLNVSFAFYLMSSGPMHSRFSNLP